MNEVALIAEQFETIINKLNSLNELLIFMSILIGIICIFAVSKIIEV